MQIIINVKSYKEMVFQEAYGEGGYDEGGRGEMNICRKRREGWKGGETVVGLSHLNSRLWKNYKSIIHAERERERNGWKNHKNLDLWNTF